MREFVVFDASEVLCISWNILEFILGLNWNWLGSHLFVSLVSSHCVCARCCRCRLPCRALVVLCPVASAMLRLPTIVTAHCFSLNLAITGSVSLLLSSVAASHSCMSIQHAIAPQRNNLPAHQTTHTSSKHARRYLDPSMIYCYLARPEANDTMKRRQTLCSAGSSVAVGRADLAPNHFRNSFSTRADHDRVGRRTILLLRRTK